MSGARPIWASAAALTVRPPEQNAETIVTVLEDNIENASVCENTIVALANLAKSDSPFQRHSPAPLCATDRATRVQGAS